MKERCFTSIKSHLNNKLRQSIRSAGRLGRFIMQAGSRYQVHSPFLYKLIGEVIRPDKRIRETGAIEAIRKECLASREIIYKTDFGAGSADLERKKYPVSIRKIAATSLTSRRRAERLYRLARFMKAQRILEIGTSLGITASYLAMADPQAKVITLEGCPELCMKAKDHFSRLGLVNIELIEGRFEDTLGGALEKLGGADLVYFDGNHRKEAVLEYFSRCMPFIGNETVFVIDDIHASAGMEQAWEEVRLHERARVSLDLFFSGWILFRKELSGQHFRLRYF
jgi:predicted O-methyltransferase YrrM